MPPTSTTACTWPRPKEGLPWPLSPPLPSREGTSVEFASVFSLGLGISPGLSSVKAYPITSKHWPAGRKRHDQPNWPLLVYINLPIPDNLIWVKHVFAEWTVISDPPVALWLCSPKSSTNLLNNSSRWLVSGYNNHYCMLHYDLLKCLHCIVGVFNMLLA